MWILMLIKLVVSVYNWCEVKAKMWVMNLGKPMDVPSLNESMAIELGANLLGEGIIFAVAAGVLFLEYNRQTRKEAMKEDARKDELELLNYTIQDLYFTTEKQDAQIRELTRLVVDLECTVNHRTWLGGRSSTHRHHTNVEEGVAQNTDPQIQTKVVKNQSVVLTALSSLGYMPESYNSRQW